MILCSPHNPASRAWTKEELTALTTDRARVDENSATYETKLHALNGKLREQMEHKETLFREFTTADAKLTALQEDMDNFQKYL